MRLEWRERKPGDFRRWLACVGALLLIAACWAALHLCRVPVCAFHRLTSLPCMTCGSSRAAALLLSGEPLAALRMQPLAVIASAGLFAWIMLGAFCLIVLRRRVRVALSVWEMRMLLGAAAISALVNWVYLVWREV